MPAWFYYLLGLVAMGASVAGTVHLLLAYRRPSAALGWLLALWELPILGPLAYLCLAVYQGPRAVRRGRRYGRELRHRANDPDPEGVYADSLPDRHFRRVAERVCPFSLVPGNRVELLADAALTQQRMGEDVAAARRRVWMQTYILGDDAVSRPFLDLLVRRAAEGLDVRLLIDPIGSVKLPGRVLRELRRRGVRCEAFLAPSPLKGRFQLNFRNHRKVLLADGVCWTGGRNLSEDDYGPEAWRDLMLRVEGPVVTQVSRVFREDWAVASAGGLEPDPLSAVEESPSEVEDAGPVVACEARAIPHGCDESEDAYPILLRAAFRAARESILVVTPYFVPGRRMLEELRLAALGGVRVRVLMPATSPERAPQWAARRSFAPLLDAGGEIWLRDAPFLHAKAVVVDECWSTVGSANFDLRSFSLNYELNLEVPGRDFAREVLARLEPDFAASRRVSAEDFRARSIWRRMQENTAALFEPIL